jgi:two-component system phosphate regulon response regulator PhoB
MSADRLSVFRAVAKARRVLMFAGARNLVHTLEVELAREGYEVTFAKYGKRALDVVRTTKPELIVLAGALPGMDLLDACRRLRTDPEIGNVPILVILARGDENRELGAFRAGATDCVTVPFSAKVLVHRVKALLRRPPALLKVSLFIEHLGIRLDRSQRLTWVDGERVDLTSIEFSVLDCLMRQPGRVFTRLDLFDASHVDGQRFSERTIDGHIKRIRRKLRRAGLLIETVHRVGYRLRGAENCDAAHEPEPLPRPLDTGAL